MTKDAVAGRIRRLLAMADKRAEDLGIPDTESAVTAGDARPVSDPWPARPPLLGPRRRARPALTGSRDGRGADRLPRHGPRTRAARCRWADRPGRRRSRRSAVTVRVGINGFGRIGRNFFRAAARRPAPTSRSWRSTT